jgi:hypothetical protein
LILGACGDDSGGGGADGPPGGGDGASGGDGPAGDSPATRDGPRPPDAGPSACSGLDQETCRGTAGCEPGCYSLCDCTCPGLGPFDPCGGCEECVQACMVWGECLDEARLTPCGESFCETATEICVARAGPVAITYRCMPVPPGCEADRTCACAGDDFCVDAFDTCNNVDPNHIECSCPACA